MDDARPLFITFKPVAEGTSTQPGHGTTLLHPQRAEQPPGQRNAQGGGPQLLPTALQVPGGALATLRARTQLWFEQTQAPRLRAEGELPAWFHGFISRRETEQLLRDEPPGCFLVRFSESTVGFVLSYRGRDRCRHFVLDQLPDGRYVILGEHSAHPELPQLLQHYGHAPIPPYNELLTVPYRQQDRPQGAMQPPGGSSPSCRARGNLAAYSTVAKRGPGARQGAERCPQGGSGGVKEELGAWRCFQGRAQAPSHPPPLPAKASSSAGTQGPRAPPSSGGAAPDTPPTQAQPEAAPTEPPDAKYQQLLRFHTYADPQEGTTRREEPIPFYAMGWGSSPSPENVYAEVALAQRELPPRGSASTLAPTRLLRQRLSRSLSSHSGQRGAPRPPLEIPQTPPNPSPLFDDPVYSPRRSSTARVVAGENVYEQVPGDRR